MTQDSGTPEDEDEDVDWRQVEFADVPRTREAAWAWGDRGEREWKAVYLVGASHAAALERELSQSRAEVERLREALQLAAQVLRDTQLIGDDQRAGKFFCCECGRHFADPDKPEHEPQCPVGRALETARAALADRQESGGEATSPPR